MQTPEPKRLYQKVAANLKKDILGNIYPIGERLPAERLLAEEIGVSRTVVREAIIMLEVEGFVDVIKGSGIHVIANEAKTPVIELPSQAPEDSSLYAGPFELLQARQLVESHIAEFAATQVTKQDIQELKRIQRKAQAEDRARDSQWDKNFHIQVAKATQNSVLVSLIESMWMHREQNPFWRKMHERIDDEDTVSWYNDHNQILLALIRKDPQAAKQAMWQHLENSKQMLFKATTVEDEMDDDRYLFSDNPVKL